MRFCPSCGSRYEREEFCPNDGTATEPLPDAPDTDPLIGTVVDGRYKVEAQIGEGGMGVVFSATHTTLKKKLALKVLRGEMSKDKEVVQRFIQEAQAATSIGHQNIIDISDFGRLEDGTVYFVMEFLDGMALTDLIGRGGSVPVAEAVDVIRQIAGALGAAHQRGIIHRDMKPDNVFLVKRGDSERFVKVLDFGIAKVGGASNKLTQTGMVFGTPHYMSPEQAAGQSVDNRTDIYALGVIMYEMLTGRVPFDADTFMGVLTKHMFEEPAPMSAEGDDRALGALQDITFRALSKKPEGRYESMEDLIADLDRVMDGGLPRTAPMAMPPGGASPSLADELEPKSRTEMNLSVQSSELPTNNGKFFAIGGAIGAVVLGLIGALVFGGGETEAKEAPKVPQAPVVAEPTPPPTPMPAAPAPAAPVAELAVVRVVSTPSNAQLVIDGAIVGQTPAPLPRPETGSRVVELRLDGYVSQSVKLTPSSADELKVTLTRRKKRAGGKASAAPRAWPKPKKRKGSRRRPGSEVVDPWAD